MNATDLRNLTVPDNGSLTVSSAVDEGDPSSVGAGYEPVQFTAEAGMMLNITIRANGEEPTLRLYDPDGNLVDTTNAGSFETAQLTTVRLDQTGRYTIQAASSEPDTTFAYTLTIDRIDTSRFSEEDELFGEGRWNETEHYLKFGEQYGDVVAHSSPYEADIPENASRGGLRANVTGDYLVFTYEFDSGYNFTRRNGIDVALAVSYTTMRERYIEFGNNTETTTNVSWVPDIIFFRGVDNETGELVRTTFLTEEWATEYGETDDSDTYLGWYYSTIRHGPGSPVYGSDPTMTDAEFPQAYHNYTFPTDNTTLAERYGL